MHYPKGRSCSLAPENRKREKGASDGPKIDEQVLEFVISSFWCGWGACLCLPLNRDVSIVILERRRTYSILTLLSVLFFS